MLQLRCSVLVSRLLPHPLRSSCTHHGGATFSPLAARTSPVLHRPRHAGSMPAAAPPGWQVPRGVPGSQKKGNNDSEEKETPVWHDLPAWAQQEGTPPLHLRVLGLSLLVPLGAGALTVHLLATGEQEATAMEEQEKASAEAYTAEDYSRLVLNWTLHYAGALLSCAGASHWGMQLAELGVPKRSDYMGLYYLCRFSAPAVFVFFGWVGSVLSTALPVEAAMWLLSGFLGLLSCDFLAGHYKVVPAWWFRWRAGFCVFAMVSIMILLLSERNLYLGQKPKIRM
eukprot:TRINITY_DN106359_c0_g1_i1.p1 TRINITY_DN106359_c0_g1~~TRINITY_DN106359_c0_g1_i1.p1  ORF type:complete len:290 (-),score=47.83 TRINITY_DN106359_c0_g1_i1:4-852(-)